MKSTSAKTIRSTALLAYFQLFSFPKLKLYGTGFLLILIVSSCKTKDDTPAYCAKKVFLGAFTPKYDIVYDGFENKYATNSIEDSATMNVNHPAEFGFNDIEPTGAELQTTDCEALKTVEKYEWNAEFRQHVFFIFFKNDDNIRLLLKQIPIVDRVSPKDGSIGSFIEFYSSDPFSGALNNTPFMRIMSEELLAGRGNAFEEGYTLLESLALNGENFSEVFTNSSPLSGAISHIYYHQEKGIIGFKRKDNTFWKFK